MRRLAFVLLIALVAADGLSFGVQAFTTQTWNTTALFNGGAKASTGTQTDTCENVTANALALNNTGNYQGIGLTTGTATCATGAWGVNPAGLVLSYDMQTLNAGKMKDFSGNGNQGTIHGSNSVAGQFGSGLNMSPNGINYVDAGTGIHFANGSVWTVGIRMRLENYPVGQGFSFMKAFTSHVSPFYQFGVRITTSPPCGSDFGFAVALYRSDTYAAYLCTGSQRLALRVWYSFIVTVDLRTSPTEKLYRNGSLISTAASPLGSYTDYNTAFTINADANLVGSNMCNQTVDELLITSGRIWNSSEITAFSTDGRSSFASSGSWSSPNVAFTTSPASVTLTGAGFTASNRPSRLRFLSSSGTVVFDTLIPSGLASPIQIPVNLTFNPATWSVKLDMIGNGTATPTLLSILVTLGVAPLFQTSDIIFLLGIILWVLGLLFLIPDGIPELPLISIVNGLLVIVWTFLYLAPTLGGGVYLVMGLGMGAILLVLGIGRFLSEATG